MCVCVCLCVCVVLDLVVKIIWCVGIEGIYV